MRLAFFVHYIGSFLIIEFLVDQKYFDYLTYMKALVTCIVLFCSIITIAKEKSRPQTPTEPFPYLSEPFQFENEEAEIMLHLYTPANRLQ